MILKNAVEGKEYIIKDIVTNDEELNSFLFSLGCYRVGIIERKPESLYLQGFRALLLLAAMLF